jgi:hypothetical protein
VFGCCIDVVDGDFDGSAGVVAGKVMVDTAATVVCVVVHVVSKVELPSIEAAAAGVVVSITVTSLPSPPHTRIPKRLLQQHKRILILVIRRIKHHMPRHTPIFQPIPRFDDIATELAFVNDDVASAAHPVAVPAVPRVPAEADVHIIPDRQYRLRYGFCGRVFHAPVRIA